MKFPLLLAAIVALLGIFPSGASAQTQSPVTFDTFFHELSPYGEWIDVDGYGTSWRPKVDSDWRPYTDGRWAQTDAGWTWMSNEPWGWITYHYGRWTTLEDGAWIWVPGYEWAPAWVSWRTNDDYIGWAPLPPEAVWEPSAGFNTSVDASYGIGIQVYTFCPVQYLGWPALRPVLMPVRQNGVILPTTTNVTKIAVRNNAIYCNGPDYARINQQGQYSVPQYQIQKYQDAVGWPASAEQQALLKQGVLPVRAPRVYPIFSATSQRSVTVRIPRHQNGPPPQQSAVQPAQAAQTVTVQPQPRIVGYPAPQQSNPSNSPTVQTVVPPVQYQQQQQAQQYQINANRQRRQEIQQQAPSSDTAVRIQQQQEQMQERNRQIQDTQQRMMRQSQQQSQADAMQQQREAMQIQLQQQQNRQQQQVRPQNQPRSQQTPPPGSGWKTLNNY
ncbi:hypothetical protein TSACC_3181 [Terrimicrobium sacchariphilum]|uniref:YXWGXW repeat-containing protein n=1 Tax=Terrimicrobium sacchariphilum TaxID=690879 RepID=A0A146GCR1_TERSA|nr:DUF6600 domain-containing protein [Terrimicrobium sacchariphilum]GAT35120.1 hypothetical protein TSACC_3181 [Terrimicrobium sacchariphilum]